VILVISLDGAAHERCLAREIALIGEIPHPHDLPEALAFGR
jgi:hypothetical protein